MKQDSERRIFTVFLYRPFRGRNSAMPNFNRPYTNFPRIYSSPSTLDLGWLIEEEWAAEAGTMALSRK